MMMVKDSNQLNNQRIAWWDVAHHLKVGRHQIAHISGCPYWSSLSTWCGSFAAILISLKCHVQQRSIWRSTRRIAPNDASCCAASKIIERSEHSLSSACDYDWSKCHGVCSHALRSRWPRKQPCLWMNSGINLGAAPTWDAPTLGLCFHSQIRYTIRLHNHLFQ